MLHSMLFFWGFSLWACYGLGQAWEEQGQIQQRKLLQSAFKAIRLSTDDCNPQIQDCSGKEECIETQPRDSNQLECSDFAQNGLCDRLSKEFCAISCGFCCSDDQPNYVSCEEATQLGLCEKVLQEGKCKKSCGECSTGDDDQEQDPQEPVTVILRNDTGGPSASPAPQIPSAATQVTGVDSEVFQSLAESEAVLTASIVFVDAIKGYETNPDVSGITGAFQASLSEGQETELLALILSVYQQIDDKDLLGRVFGAVAVQGGQEVIQILAGGVAQVAVASGCEGVGLSLVQLTNATNLGGQGEIWQEAIVGQGNTIVQCLGVDVEDCKNEAQDDCCTEAEGFTECHFCEFDIGCRYKKDASSIESLGLLIYNDRFFQEICKCPIA